MILPNSSKEIGSSIMDKDMFGWHLEKRKLTDLKPYFKNPRQLTEKEAQQLKRSIARFGLADKPIINLDNVIIGGHQRIAILKDLGYSEVECWVPNRKLNDAEIEEFCLRLNRNHGSWDWDILANEFEEEKLEQWGFDLKEFEINIEKIEGLEDDETEILELSKDPITKLGDLYLLGNHRLLCGDSTNPEDVTKLLNGAEPILMVTDPPYGVNYNAAWRGIAGKGCQAAGKVLNDDQINWSLAWYLFPGSIAYVWHAGKHCSEVQKSLEESGFEIISQIIWAKQHFALSRGDYHWHHEPCWYAVKKGHQHNWQGARDQSTLWEISNLNACGGKHEEGEERTAHGTQKPLECMAKPIRNNTAESESVYDPFLGSGTTLIAAEKLNRICYGMELDPAYCDIIISRWEKITGKTAIKNLKAIARFTK